MTKSKIIKDSVHNYIEIEEPFFKIIDTAGFQRLKNVKQTSYSSLYPSSTHDRFTHSLGTYYLGKTVINNIFQNMKIGKYLSSIKQEQESIKFTFIVACLLHDYGHAPFSHTGEDFYKVKKITRNDTNYSVYNEYICVNKITNFSYIDYLLINELCNISSCDICNPNEIVTNFLEDYKKTLRDNSAKPHEKISALLSLKQLKEQIYDIAKDFSDKKTIIFNADLFIRCIIGTQYTNKEGKNTFYNAVIQLLNSDCIDVDKLDYLMRDTFMTGHKSTNIDIDRLVSSFTVIAEGKKQCRLAFKKKGLSVIENVIQASDSSKRWVQNHPVIIYDSYLTQRCIGEMIRLLSEKEKDFANKLFSIEALTEEGIEILKEKYFLLSDTDLIGLFKKAYNIALQKKETVAIEFFKEYFSRKDRRHPLWKSEMEYNICFDKHMDSDQEEIHKTILAAVKALDEFRKDSGVKQLVFNDSILKRLNDEGCQLPSSAQPLINTLQTFFKNNGIEFDIAIISTTSFETKLGKLKRKNFLVEMPDYKLDGWNQNENLYSYADLVSIEESKGHPMFYLYSKQNIDVKKLINFLFNQANL